MTKTLSDRGPHLFIAKMNELEFRAYGEATGLMRLRAHKSADAGLREAR
jgi:hypothetical protein